MAQKHCSNDYQSMSNYVSLYGLNLQPFSTHLIYLLYYIYYKYIILYLLHYLYLFIETIYTTQNQKNYHYRPTPFGKRCQPWMLAWWKKVWQDVCTCWTPLSRTLAASWASDRGGRKNGGWTWTEWGFRKRPRYLPKKKKKNHLHTIRTSILTKSTKHFFK